MSIPTRIALLATALMLAGGPVLAAGQNASIHENKDKPGVLEQPYVPGYNQSPEADADAKSPPSVGSEAQRANRLPDEPDVIGLDSSWPNRVDYLAAADDAVNFWQDQVARIDPETVRLDEIRDLLAGLEDGRTGLGRAEQDGWSSQRAAFEDDLLALREEYLELPAARKSSAPDVNIGGTTSD